MKIFYLTSKPPYPIIDGGCYASASFLQTLLKSGQEVKHFTLATHKHPFEINEYPKKIQSQTNVEACFIDTRLKPLPAMKALFESGSYNMNRFYHPEASKQIVRIIKESNFDLIILDSLYAAVFLNDIRKVFNKKIILRTHNVEHEIWNSLAAHSKSKLKAKYLYKLAKDLKKVEQEIFEKVDLILSISEEDSDQIKSLCHTPVHTVRVPVKLLKNTIRNDAEAIFHIGSVLWPPNQESLEQVMRWMPDIIAQHPEIHLHIAGSGLHKQYQNSYPAYITEHGFVADINEFALNHGIMLAPILSGSGVRIKILETMALGIPVITSTVGAKGIADRSALMIADGKDEFLNKLNLLLANAELRNDLGERAKAYIRNYHNRRKIGQELNQILEHAIA